MKKSIKSLAVLTLLLVVSQFHQAHAAGVSGAIFTTNVDATIVNANTQYTSKCQVYLDGGPGANAPAGAAGLPDGDYYFQVTDPNGRTLLSTDPVSNRRFHVSGGVIAAYTGIGGPSHSTGTDVPHASSGAITISLANSSCPTDFLDTSNGGGVYKVWVTPVGSFAGDATLVDPPCGAGCYHGFVPSASKTDNFKVQATQATFCLYVAKVYTDPTGNTATVSWPITVTETTTGVPIVPSTVTPTDGTPFACNLTAGVAYTVTEGPNPNTLPPGYTTQVIGLTFDQATQTPQTAYTFTWSAGQPAPTIVFTNEAVPIG